MEIGIGVSIAGRRALVCTKSVGMNAMVDPLMVLNLTPVHGGLVILLGDDPGRLWLAERPGHPPARLDARDAHDGAGDARRGLRHDADGLRGLRAIPYGRDRPRDAELHPAGRAGRHPRRALTASRSWASPASPGDSCRSPGTSSKKHRELHERLAALRTMGQSTHPSTGSRGPESAESSRPGSSTGSCSTSSATTSRRPSPPQARRPVSLAARPRVAVPGGLPRGAGARGKRAVPRNPDQGDRARLGLRVPGSSANRPGTFDREGELFRWQIQQALERFLPGFVPARSYREEGEAAERPPRENHCAGCRFGVIVDALRDVAAGLGQNPVLVADPGCLTPVADRSTPSTPSARRSALPRAWPGRGSASARLLSSAIPRSSTPRCRPSSTRSIRAATS